MAREPPPRVKPAHASRGRSRSRGVRACGSPCQLPPAADVAARGTRAGCPPRLRTVFISVHNLARAIHGLDLQSHPPDGELARIAVQAHGRLETNTHEVGNHVEWVESWPHA